VAGDRGPGNLKVSRTSKHLKGGAVVDDDTHGRVITQEPPVTYLTPKDLQRELRIGEKLCYRLLQNGTIPSIRIGGVYRIHRSRLEEALDIQSDLSREA
jgi:excisionase family DNA binding protein